MFNKHIILWCSLKVSVCHSCQWLRSPRGLLSGLVSYKLATNSFVSPCHSVLQVHGQNSNLVTTSPAGSPRRGLSPRTPESRSCARSSARSSAASSPGEGSDRPTNTARRYENLVAGALSTIYHEKSSADFRLLTDYATLCGGSLPAGHTSKDQIFAECRDLISKELLGHFVSEVKQSPYLQYRLMRRTGFWSLQYPIFWKATASPSPRHAEICKGLKLQICSPSRQAISCRVHSRRSFRHGNQSCFGKSRPKRGQAFVWVGRVPLIDYSLRPAQTPALRCCFMDRSIFERFRREN